MLRRYQESRVPVAPETDSLCMPVPDVHDRTPSVSVSPDLIPDRDSFDGDQSSLCENDHASWKAKPRCRVLDSNEQGRENGLAGLQKVPAPGLPRSVVLDLDPDRVGVA